jgi:hypothetical protein
MRGIKNSKIYHKMKLEINYKIKFKMQTLINS